MRYLLKFLFLFCLTATAAEYRTFTLTLTNGTATGDQLYIDGNVRTGATVRTQYGWVTNSSQNISATNILSQLGGFRIPNVLVSQTDTNVLVFKGSDIVVTSTPFAVITATTQALGPVGWEIRAPASLFVGSKQNSNGTEIVNYINATTNPISSVATGLVHFVGLTNIQTVRDKVFTNSLTRKGTNDGVHITNTPAIYVTNFYAQVINADGSTSLLSGTISGGRLLGASVTNAPWLNATNANLGTARIDTMTVWTAATITNLSAPGTNTGTLKVGAGAVAGNPYDVSLGDLAVSYGSSVGGNVTLGYNTASVGDTIVNLRGFALGSTLIAIQGSADTATNSIAIGGNVDGFNDSVSIGFSSVATSTNQVRLGTASETVSIPGVLKVESGISNSVTTGTNSIKAEVSLVPRVNATVISGYVSALNLGTNAFVRVTGASGAFTNASFTGGYAGLRVLVEMVNPSRSCVLLDHSSIGAPASTEQINLGTTTGGSLQMTNNPAVFELIHNGAEWVKTWNSH